MLLSIAAPSPRKEVNTFLIKHHRFHVPLSNAHEFTPSAGASGRKFTDLSLRLQKRGL